MIKKGGLALADKLRRHLIDDGNILEALTPSFVKVVDLLCASPQRDIMGAKHSMLLSAQLPETKMRDQVVCLFPNHPNAKQQILRCDVGSSGSLSALNKCVNESLRNSLDVPHEKFAVAYGKHVFVFRNIRGTVYIVWAEYINRENESNVRNTIYENHPIVIICDGRSNFRHIFMLKNDVQTPEDLQPMPLSSGNPCISIPREPIFVCESRPEPQPQRTVETMTRQDARAMVTQRHKPTQNWLHYDRLAFDAAGIVDSNSDSEMPWQMSPRDIMNNSNNMPLLLVKETQQQQQQQAVISTSARLPEPDPWEELSEEQEIANTNNEIDVYFLEIHFSI